MASDKIITWLKVKRRNALVVSLVYSVLGLVSGGVVLAFMFAVMFAFVRIFLQEIPDAHLATVASIGVAATVVLLIGVDSIRAHRDDMSVIPIWLCREYVHIGPRVIREGFRSGLRAARLARLDLEVCANVLADLAEKNRFTSKSELMRAFPGLVWADLVAQLRMLEGVLILRPEFSRVSLTMALRLELRDLMSLKRPGAIPAPEPEPVPVEQPEKLAPCDILGVSPSASLAEIKTAYRTRIKECHPDRFPGVDEKSRELAEEWTKALNAAYHSMLSQHSGPKADR